MVKELLLVPLAAVIVIGFMLQLASVAESTSQKTLDYADDMNEALDCAFRGVDIEVCSPDLNSYDFKSDANEFMEMNKKQIKQLEGYIEQMNGSIKYTNSSNGSMTIVINY